MRPRVDPWTTAAGWGITLQVDLIFQWSYRVMCSESDVWHYSISVGWDLMYNRESMANSMEFYAILGMGWEMLQGTLARGPCYKVQFQWSYSSWSRCCFSFNKSESILSILPQPDQTSIQKNKTKKHWTSNPSLEGYVWVAVLLGGSIYFVLWLFNLQYDMAFLVMYYLPNRISPYLVGLMTIQKNRNAVVGGS